MCDEGGVCADQVLTIDVADSAADVDNTPPVALNDLFEAVTDPLAPQTLSSDLFGNDGDPDGDPILVLESLDGSGMSIAAGTAFTTANGGTATVNPDGSFDYTPAPGFVGVDSFEYTIVDPSGATNSAIASFNVQPDSTPGVNDAPDANDDALVTQLNTASDCLLYTSDAADE